MNTTAKRLAALVAAALLMALVPARAMAQVILVQHHRHHPHHHHHHRRLRRSTIRVRRLIVVARREIGRPYVWGATGPWAFDCSGLVQYVYRHVGVLLPRTTWGMMDRGRRVYGPLHPGDLVFFFNGEHVGIYLGRGRFEDAPHTGARVGVRTLASYGGYYTARRVIR